MTKDSNSRKAERAIQLVEQRERKEGRDVKRARLGSGYDLISRDARGHTRKIEVKGTAKPDLAIPDMAETEFDRNRRLKATHLYVIANIKRRPKLYKIRRGDLDHVLRGNSLKKLIRWRVPEPAQKSLRHKIKGEVLRIN